MSRIDDTFARLRAEAQTGLVTFVTAGDPDMDRSALVLETIDRAGADVLEVGIPFSDPLADGPVIQRSSERALAGGTTLAASLDLVARVRPRIAAAVVVFSYANPVFAMGLETFVHRASDAGVDGVLILDLPDRGVRWPARRDRDGWDGSDLPAESDDDRDPYPTCGDAGTGVSVRDLEVGCDR